MPVVYLSQVYHGTLLYNTLASPLVMEVRPTPRTSPYTIELSPDETRKLEALARKYTAPYRDVIRAKIILLAAQGVRNDQIAQRLDLPTQIVYKWRKRFFEDRLAGLHDRSRQPHTARSSSPG
jgi:hypothetical protein